MQLYDLFASVESCVGTAFRVTVTYTENFGVKVRQKDTSKFPMPEVNQ